MIAITVIGNINHADSSVQVPSVSLGQIIGPYNGAAGIKIIAINPIIFAARIYPLPGFKDIFLSLTVFIFSNIARVKLILQDNS